MQTKVLIVLASITLAAGCGERSSRGTAEAIYPPKPARAEVDPAIIWEEGGAPEEVQRVAGIDDQEFVRMAASSGTFEVESSRLVLDQFATSEAESIAEEMMNDHVRINQQLEALAALKGWTVPTTLLPSHQEMLNQLETAPAGSLGDVYLSQQLRAHEEAIELFERCTRQCRDDDLREFAGTTLLMLREHKRAIETRTPVAPRR